MQKLKKEYKEKSCSKEWLGIASNGEQIKDLVCRDGSTLWNWITKEFEPKKANPIDEIILDSETSIRVGYDECEINDGVAPDKILASGIIEGQKFNLIIMHHK